MLPKTNRLHTSTEIGHVRRNGARKTGHYVTMFILDDQTQPAPRFAFIVSKKISKRAVDRNRSKRLMREAVKQLLPNLQPSTQVVVLAKTNLFEVPLQSVLNDIESVLR